MIALPLWARLIFWAVLLAGGVYLGWTVESWREGAANARALKAQLETERDQHAKSEASRIRLAGDLAKATGTIHIQIKEVIRRVPQLIRDDRACDFSGELIGVLNRTRGYDMPGSGRAASVAAAATAKTP